MNTIKKLYNYFVDEISRTNKLIEKSSLFYQNALSYEGLIYDKELHDLIVQNCFINNYLTWEYFLENSFILYLCGQNDLNGKSYTVYCSPTDNIHAYDMIKGTKNYPDWTNIDDIIKLSNIYFDDDGPFSYLKCSPVELSDMKTIRNKISHCSSKCEKSYNRLLSKTISKTSGVSVSDFLLMMKGESTYYTHYTNLLQGYVDAICNK